MKMQRYRSGITLIEMLVVMGIIAILTGASVAAYSRVTRTAERAKEQQLVNDIATALTVIYQKQGSWPQRLATEAHDGQGGQLDENAALALANAGVLNLTTYGSGDNKKLSGQDKFGVLTSWGAAVVKRIGEKASKTTPVEGTATIQDHILHYSLDMDGDGIIKGANVGGVRVDVRATAIVWSCGKDGKVSAYRTGGGKAKCDDVYSWQPGQTREIQ